MKLYNLLSGYEYSTHLQDIEIKGITSDSRQVEKGYVFVCIKGLKTDGHSHAQKALEQGASVVVCEKDLGIKEQVLVYDTRKIYGGLCGNFFDNPSYKLKIIGITGTNGKTTCTYLIKEILEKAGKKVGLIGTIHNEIGDMVLPARHTTPDPFYLHSMISSMVKAECEYLVMEVSSHALEQHRLEGITFEIGVFTNLTQDHLDYHKTMENYFLAKKKLYDISKTAIINIDDSYGERLAQEINCKVATYSKEKDDATYTAKNVNLQVASTRFAFVGSGTIARMEINMPGDFSVSNAMAAASCGVELGIPVDVVAKGLTQSSGVKGRLELIYKGEFTIIRDYAHTPDALEKVLKTIKEFAKGRVITLFGCPGVRDKSKRHLMGEIAVNFSDFVIITSDNPREENPREIIEDTTSKILKQSAKYKVIIDRYDAIKWAVENSVENDILLLAGKGHEDYQVLADATHYFDEKEIVKELLKNKP